MKLSTYLDERSLSLAEFGRLIGVSAEAVRRYRGDRVPESKVLARIYDVTGGAVTPNDFFAGVQPDIPSQAIQAAE